MGHLSGWPIACSASPITGGPGEQSAFLLAHPSLPRYSPAHTSAADHGYGRRGERVDVAQIGLLLVGWVVAFLLGKELQAGFVQWREGRRGE